MKKIARRSFILSSLGGILLAGQNNSSSAATRQATPSEIEGPFYPVVAQQDQDFDLTRVQGKPGVAKGRIITIEGKVTNTEGKPIESAMVDLWQANAAGRYRHPHDTNTAPLDPLFQGWAIVPSGQMGKFKFKTIIPGKYPASSAWTRPPHIHFKVTKLGYHDVITQMYFPGEALNVSDLLLIKKTKSEQEQMTAKRDLLDKDRYYYSIVLSKVEEGSHQ